MDYNRTLWKDHIKDQNGNVIQQGTPVSAKNLNNIENQVVALSAKENSLAELVREAIPSGFTTLSDLDYSYMSTNPNSIRLTNDSVAYVNGYKIVITAGTIITLDAPPTSGTRDDLVFLEAWKQLDANGAEQLSWRLRVVDGVDFLTYSEGLGVTSSWYDNKIPAQGANASPVATVTTDYIDTVFRNAWTDTNISAFNKNDKGLYVSGNGSATGKSILGTTDGYVYAIPMFKVHRRNSGGYSVNNSNGADNCFNLNATFTWNQGGLIINGTLVQSSSLLKVNQRVIWYATTDPWRGNEKNSTAIITSVSGNTFTMTLTNGEAVTSSQTSPINGHILLKCRPDYVFADIIVDRDIIDLRHKVSLTGFNYQQLLEENFNKLLRGDLQTTAKTTMLKTYHGIAKTPIDSNHVFYASFDGTIVAEVGGNSITSPSTSMIFSNNPTGVGVGFPMADDGVHDLNLSYQLSQVGANVLTVDAWLKPIVDSNGNYNCFYFSLMDSFNNAIVTLYKQWGNSLCVNSASWSIVNGKMVTNKPFHIRIIINTTTIRVFINGSLLSTINSTFNVSSITKLRLPVQGAVISDISVSNIDRGSAFATLPQDFIDGYARISPAFNSQRSVFSDALTSETPLAQVKCAGGNSKEITVGDSSVFPKVDTTKWNSGDRIKIKGISGEIISGVIDGDTVIAKITQSFVASSASTVTLYVDDVSKISVSDTLQYYNLSNGGTYQILSVTAIDTVNKILTCNITNGLTTSINMQPGDLLFETTASSSSPVVKANLIGTAQAGAGSTITLGSAFSVTDGAYNGLTITITSGTGAGQVRTISGYVGSTKVATVSSAWSTNPDATSVYLITGVPITGTWSNLGTNEATFTLGANSGLVAQDLLINYSLNEVAGQGGISEVLISTLAGESNGKKLVVNGLHVRDDFAGKVSGSTTICPNFIRYNQSPSLGTPSVAYGEFTTNSYVHMNVLDGVCEPVSTSTNGQFSQQLFSFNIIRILEDKFGPLPCPPDAASKVAWIKANTTGQSSIRFNWWGYGVCPGGNKATIGYWDGSNWGGDFGGGQHHSYNAIVQLHSECPLYSIQPDGYVHFIAYAPASDGVTSSTIYTDYANIEITLNIPTGYDALTPENPRRDDGKSNILLVRKETKEIQTMFLRCNSDGIVTYGDYVPKQNYMAISKGTGDVVNKTSFKGFLCSIGTGSGRYYPLVGYYNKVPRMDGITLLNGLLSDVFSEDVVNLTSSSIGGSLWYIRKYFVDNLDIDVAECNPNNGGYVQSDQLDSGGNITMCADTFAYVRNDCLIVNPTSSKIFGAYGLVQYQNAIWLLVLAGVCGKYNSQNAGIFISPNIGYNLIPLKNKPLVK